MDYTHFVQRLNKASVFDLYRLHVAIGNELENPNRILSLRQKLQIGMELSYFDHIENRLVKAKLLRMKQKNVVAFDYEQNKRFSINYLNLKDKRHNELN